MRKRQLSDLRAYGKFSGIHKPLLDLKLDLIIPNKLHLLLRATDVFVKALKDTARTYGRHQVPRIRRSYIIKVLDV